MASRRTFQALLALFVAVISAGVLAFLPRPSRSVVLHAADLVFVDEGETPQIRSFYGFNLVPERDDTGSWRWTDGVGNFVVRHGARLGTPLLLELRVCACRHGEQAPRQVLIGVNGETLANVADQARDGNWRTYRLLLPQRSPAYFPDVFVNLVSDTIQDAHGQQLGVRLDTARLGTPAAWLPAYSPVAASVLGIMVGLLTLLTLGRGGTRAGILVALAGLALTALQGTLYRPHPLPAAVLAGLLLVAAALGVVLWRPAGPDPGKLVAHSAANARSAVFGAVLLCLLVVAIQVLGAWIVDDAFISFRYASNLLHGYGPVFNPGERVEGYTNFLWTVLFVPILGLGLAPATASQALTLLLAIMTAALVWSAGRWLAGIWPALGALALLITAAPFLLWTARGSGMETALFALLLLAGITAYMRDQLFAAGLLLGLAAMTRPEGVLVCGLSGLHLLAMSLWRRQIVWSRLVALALGFLVLFGPFFLWRYSYYGYLLPNTFYAKVGGSGAQLRRGLKYAADFGLAHTPLLALSLLALLPIPRRDRRLVSGRQHTRSIDDAHPPPQAAATIAAGGGQAQAVYLGLLVTGYSLYIIVVGGDHFPFFRFFVPILPLLGLMAALGLRSLASRFSPGGLLLLVVGLAWHTPQLYRSYALNPAEQVWRENSVVEKNREIGLWLRASTPPDTLIATGIAGALPYYAERPVLDTLGLNDLHIAHLEVPNMGEGEAGSEKSDIPYILGRRPDYIPFNTAGTLIGVPEFERDYIRGIIHGPEGRWFRMFRHAGTPPPPGWHPD